MLLFTTTGYEAREFIQAAANLGVDTILGSDRCHILDDPWQDTALPLRFEKPQEAAQRIVEHVRSQPVRAILPVGDTPLLTAALASKALGLRYNAPDAVMASRNKFLMRQRLHQAGLRIPWSACFSTQTEPYSLLPQVSYPCVLKPLALSASRGVIRANDPEEFIDAFWRLRALLETPEIRMKQDTAHQAILVEGFIPGREVALEGLLDTGHLRLLALFDKPDPLDGPFFEETIYLTPSRLPPATQQAIVRCTTQAAQALGLTHGPLHAELRINQEGPWLVEIAARSIGGL
jgi:biotin carboxylase